MITRSEYEAARQRAAEAIRRAGVVIRREEEAAIAVADFGLGRLDAEGAQILTLVDTDRISAKVIVLFGGQALPEHWHPPVGDDPGKEETLRAIRGPVYVYVPGEPTAAPDAAPSGKGRHYTARHRIVLGAGEQVTVAPGVAHWLRAGPDGAILYSFSTTARDILDRFTDPDVRRETIVVDDGPDEGTFTEE